MRPRRWAASALVVVITGCTLAAEPSIEALPDVSTTTTTTMATTTTTEPPRVCSPGRPSEARIVLDRDPTIASLELSRAVFPDCADHVVVSTDDPAALATAAGHAIEVGGPLLVVSGTGLDEVTAEIARLRPLEVVSVGATGIGRPPETRLTELDPDPAAEIPSASGASLWIVDGRSPVTVAITAAAGDAVGAQTVTAPTPDLRALDPEIRALVRERQDVTMVGRFGAAADWQLEVVRRGLELPGGGQLLFPGRRLIALYGSPYSSALGVLGEQSVEESIVRAQDLADDYDVGDGVLNIPAFEIIATVASAGAGEDGDYSAELSVEDLRPWVEAAGEAGVYVLIDLQPGRTDFLTQAKRYEELLRLPHVGLALDPEWRLGPDQVHLRQIGTVTAAEINTVSQWLAGIVRAEALPQKLFLLHQFKLSMITERDTIETPAELATVIQMDGQGPIGSKFGTYAAITDGALDSGWWWGWKNFYDEDDPTPTPEQTLSADPEPVFISYQ